MSLVPNIWAFLRKLYLYALVILNKGLIINLVMISLLRFIRYSSVCVCAQSCPTLCDHMDYSPPTRFLCACNFPGKNTGVGCHFLLQGIFPTQGSNLSLLHQQAGSLTLHPRYTLVLMCSKIAEGSGETLMIAI